MPQLSLGRAALKAVAIFALASRNFSRLPGYEPRTQRFAGQDANVYIYIIDKASYLGTWQL